MPQAKEKNRRTGPAPFGRSVAAVFFGMAHAFDLGGTLVRDRGRFSKGPAADADALRGDWMTALGHADRLTPDGR